MGGVVETDATFGDQDFDGGVTLTDIEGGADRAHRDVADADDEGPLAVIAFERSEGRHKGFLSHINSCIDIANRCAHDTENRFTIASQQSGIGGLSSRQSQRRQLAI